MDFPSNQIGPVWTHKIVTDTQRGTWGSGAHRGDLDTPKAVAKSFSIREPIVHGDRVTATFYGRYGAAVKADDPYIYRNFGTDGNGYYDFTWNFHMSQFLIPEVWNHVVDPPQWGSQLGNMKAKVETEFLGKLRDTKVELGENIGQAVQSANMIAEPLKILLQAYLYARKGNWAGVKSLLGPPREYLNGMKLSQGWLQYYYGWKPLISDAYFAAEALEKGIGRQTTVFKTVKTGSTSLDLPNAGSPGAYDADFNFTAKYKIGVKSKLHSDALASLGTLGLDNPLALAWQLTPLSFVIDWFIPLGNVLGGLSAGLGLDFVGGYSTLIEEGTARVYRRNEPVPPGWEIVNPGNLETSFKRMQRIPLYSLPMPRVYVRENPFKTERVLSALSLMRQLI